MGTLWRTCATVPRPGPLPKLLWANLFCNSCTYICVSYFCIISYTVIILYSIDFIQQFSARLQACFNRFLSCLWLGGIRRHLTRMHNSPNKLIHTHIHVTDTIHTEPDKNCKLQVLRCEWCKSWSDTQMQNTHSWDFTVCANVSRGFLTKTQGFQL